MAILEIRLLGGLQVRYNDADAPHFVSSKVPALLAYLAVNRRPHQRDALAGLLWGEMPDDAAANNLRQALTNLRKVAEPHFLITRETVAFNREIPTFLDVEAFRAATLTHREQTPAAQAAQIRQAMALYGGDFLEGFYVHNAPDFEEWVLAERLRLRELAQQSLHTLTELQLGLGDFPAAIESATHLLAMDPWREEAHRHLMLALARSGQRSAALAQFVACRRTLREAFDVEPDEETTALYERIRAAGRGPRHNLPATTTGFVGRESEQADLLRQLASPNTRLLTLLGPGGAGKTRLALEVAAAAEPRFLNGVWFVSLAAASPTQRDALPLAVAEALRVPLAGGDPRKQLINFLRQKELLLVLDNLEHLIEPASWLGDVLTEAPDVKLLVTSRERLRLLAERVVELDGLPLPAASSSSAEAFDAVQLFVRRSQRVQPSFAFTPQNAADVTRICQLVQGLPLGIELAAAWVHLLSCHQIATEIAANLDFLTSQHRDVAPRQRSLRAVFDHSWNLLSAEDRDVFCRLAVFRGSFDREAAAAVAGATLSALASLVDKSLLRGQDGRYDLHEVVRQYATERLGQSGQLAEVQDRHAATYARLLQVQGRLLDTPQQREAIEAIAADIDNVRAAWKHAVRERQIADLEASLTPLYRYFDVRNGHLEGRDALAAAVTTLSDNDEPATDRLLCRLLARQGALDNRLGRHQEAAVLLQQALAMAQAQDQPAEIVFCQLQMSYTMYAQGELAEAQQQLQTATALARSLGDELLLADVVESLAAVTASQGDFPEARRLHLESLALVRRHGDYQSMIIVLSNLGSLAHMTSEYSEARRLYEEASAIARELGDSRSLGICLHNLADVAYRLGNYAESERLGQEGLAIFEESGVRIGVAHARLNLARTTAALGRSEEARRQFCDALSLTLELQAVSLAVEVIMEMAPWLAQGGQRVMAVEALAFAVQHPALHSESRDRAQAWLAEIIAGMSPKEADAAVARGQLRSLTEVAADVMAT